jgi:hypothetical protein
MKKAAWLLLLLAMLLLYGCVHYVWYGSLTSSCTYTERDVPVPAELATGQITLTRAAYVAEGVDPGYACLPVLGQTAREIVAPSTIANQTVGEKYFTQRGQKIGPLPQGKTFRVARVLAVTKHGLSTIDSGSGPLYYLLLADEAGQNFALHAVAAGINPRDEYLQFVSPSGETSMLGASSFISPLHNRQPRFNLEPAQGR